MMYSSMNKKALPFLLCFFLLSLCALSQVHISGKVVDSLGKPVPFVIVTPWSQNNSFTSQVTDLSGDFSFTQGKVPSYLTFISVGHRKKKILLPDTSMKEIHLGFIFLKDTTFSEKEVVVTSPKNLIERKADRLVFHVDRSVTLIGTDALEVLKSTPGIKVNDHDISMIGKTTVNVMLNDRPIQLSQDDLLNFLRSISSSEISQIEILPNPPAQYGAEGNSGLINIRLHAMSKMGLNGSILSSYKQSYYGTSDVAGTLNFGKNKLSLRGSFNFVSGSIHPVVKINTSYKDETSSQYGYQKSSNTLYNSTFGLHYAFTKKTAVGIYYIGSINPNKSKEDITNSLSNPFTTQLDSTAHTAAQSTGTKSTHDLNFHFEKSIDSTGKIWTADIDYLTYADNKTRAFNTLNYFPSGNQTSYASFNKNEGAQNISIATAKTDFIWPTSVANLSTGIKATYIANHNDNRFETLSPEDVYLYDSSKSNQFNYTENTYAGYVNAEKTIKKVTLQMGLRAEHTQTRGESINLQEVHVNNYFRLFPTFYFLYTLNENSQLNLSYGKRINRPNYNDLNPFRFYISPYQYSEGNPFLQPSFAHNADLNYTYKNQHTIGAYSQVINNLFTQVPVVDDSHNVFIYQRHNIGTALLYGFYYTNTLELFNRLISSTTLDFYEYHLAAQYNEISYNTSQLSLELATENQIRLTNNGRYVFQLAGMFTPPGNRNGIYKLKGMYKVDLGLKIILLKNKQLSFTLSGSDIFFRANPEVQSISSGNNITALNTYDTRNIKIALVYRFGTQKTKLNNTSSNEEERNRLNK